MPMVNVRIKEHIFIADSEQPLINAVPDSTVMKGCLKGVCRVCRCKLKGGVVYELGNQVAIDKEFLPCISYAQSDVEIAPLVNNFSVAQLITRNFLSENIVELTFKIKRTFFSSKAIVNIKHPSESLIRSYSVVSLGVKNYDFFVLHIKLRPNGIFSNLFQKLAIGDQLEYNLNNHIEPEYEKAISTLNIVSGGSGMGAALTRGLDLIRKNPISKVNIYAINRSVLSHYHQHCVNVFREQVEAEVNIINIPFCTWTNNGFDFSNYLDSHELTVGVGSTPIINKILNQPLCELESFGP
ncbi:2Fe-2S iron-sulfur cluster binding domain-containing protein [Acinetobacter sp. V102_4]|uniref:2Fe-2S iron-sulfur cluster binding domain-containing protein n=1 Tax=Acinetobacter sp. V102_4 TaxID=3072984 RepID=UPI00287BCC78|nr:2Fe-2S iron-sulfur cluster binding domain-containing protein [Acinetobacter sp. V102_4]MDS7928403.1 2Fe-2S iron-sulfur cluster binding domain-containing protein [Acinetobacter sp. V102_4]